MEGQKRLTLDNLLLYSYVHLVNRCPVSVIISVVEGNKDGLNFPFISIVDIKVS